MMIILFFFNDTATTEIYTLSLHDALPISARSRMSSDSRPRASCTCARCHRGRAGARRSEEHTSELQSRLHLVCRLLLEKKKSTHRDAFVSIINYTASLNASQICTSSCT